MGITLKRLDIENYKQHTRREVEFVGNIVGVVGENGAGKSNLLGALHFALAGEQPGFKRTDLLKWGAKKGHVALDFEFDGKPARVVRKLQSNSAEFEFDGAKVSGTAKVAEAMAEALALDKDLLRQTVFVRQSEIEAVLFEDPAVRALGFQKLCGIGDANKIHKKMGEILGSVPPDRDYDAESARLAADLSRLEEQRRDVETRAQAAEAKLAGVPDQDTLRKSSVLASAAAVNCDRRAGLSAELDSAVARVAAKTAELEQMPEPESDTGFEAGEAEIKVLEDKIAVWQHYLRTRDELTKAQTGLEGLGPCPEPTPGLAEQVKAGTDAVEELQARFIPARNSRDNYVKLKEALGRVDAGVPCPVCDTPIRDAAVLDRKIAEAEAELKASSPAAAMALRDELKTKLEYETNAIASWKSKYDVLKAAVEAAETAALKASEAVNEHPETRDADACRARTAEIRAEMDAVRQRERVRAVAGSELAAARAAEDRASAELAKVESELHAAVKYFGLDEALLSRPGELKPTLTELGRSCDDAARQSQEFGRQVAELKGLLSGVDGQLAAIKKAMADVERDRKASESRNKTMKTLVAVRQWFHYSNGPQTLVKSVLEDMNADVNAFLDKFGSSFQVYTNPETMGFLYRNLDGSPMPDSLGADTMHLSGGQKIQLALAFRFAAYCMFAGKLGILSLDEPTVYLDERHVGLFCGLLEQMKSVAEKMGLQVLLATHERAVMPFLDTVIEV